MRMLHKERLRLAYMRLNGIKTFPEEASLSKFFSLPSEKRSALDANNLLPFQRKAEVTSYLPCKVRCLLSVTRPV